MSDRPAGHLKCVGYQFRMHDGIPVEHYVFDDGSTWICRNANSWSLDWNPEPNSASHAANSDDPEPKPVADLESVKPYVTVPEKTFAELHRKFEDLKLEEAELRVKIRDWQKVNEITAKQRDDAKARIAELEEHLKAWQEAASVDHVENPDEPPTPCQTPEQLVERLRSLFRWATRAEERAKNSEAEANAWKDGANPDDYFAPDDEIKTPDGLARELKNLREVIADQKQEFESELAILKAKPQEVPPLDKWRVLMTAHRFCGEQSCEMHIQVSKAFWGLLGSYIWNAFEIEGKTGVKPYPVK